MNILIVGNGFDLSHYLPTKYDHFMVAMGAIENWDKSKGDMDFDDLFESLYEKEDYFFGYTKAMYDTDQIKISVEQITKLKKKLEENVWYQYFSDHVREVKTWIDFETKIKEALGSVCKFLKNIEDAFDGFGDCNLPVYLLEKDSKKNAENYYISLVESQKLITLKLINKNLNYGKQSNFWTDEKLAELNRNWFFSSERCEYGFCKDKYICFLGDQLECMISLFNCYLVTIIDNLCLLNKSLRLPSELERLDSFLSFNYTITYKKNYQTVRCSVEYIHGKLGEEQNIVLGISELNNSILKEMKAYNFTKYHQKIVKNTNYVFLYKIIEDIKLKYKNYEYCKTLPDSNFQSGSGFSSTAKKDHLREMYKKINEEKNIYIWGHSLDVSDQDYISEVFSLNSEYDQNVRVIIYFFDSSAKSVLLSNLFYILGKDKVERWVKNAWLKFELNPDIAKLNNIKPVELPKIAKA